MAGGRPPIPDAINYLRGDPGKRRRYELTPDAGPSEVPQPPEYLDAYALEEWNFIAPVLAGLRVLSKADTTALVCYCEAWSRYRTLQDFMKEPLPFVAYDKIAKSVDRTANVMRAMLIEFGLTPAARARMKIKAQEAEQKASKWAGLVKLA